MAIFSIVAGVVALGLIGWLLASVLRPRVRLYQGQRVDDLPDQPSPFVVYIAGSGENVWAASMVCPCGCEEIIELNLLKQVRPQWQVSEDPDGSVSIHPSVWRNSGCRSHFILRQGAIHWCR